MVDAAQNRLNMSLARAHQNVDDAAQTLVRMIEETRRQITKELDNAYGSRQLQLTVIDKKVGLMAFPSDTVSDSLSDTLSGIWACDIRRGIRAFIGFFSLHPTLIF